MKKIIGKIEYDTATAELVKKVICGYYGDQWGYEESLYQTEDGHYFFYGNGGPESPYPHETIKRAGAKTVKAWLDRFTYHGGSAGESGKR